MASTGTLLQKDRAFQALAREEARLRPLYLRLERDAVMSQGRGEDKELVQNSARFLELFLVAVCFAEVMGDTASALPGVPMLRDWLRRTADLTGLDPKEVAREALIHLPGFAELTATAEPSAPVSFSALVRASRSLLEACPIDGLERMAAARGLESWGHRCRLAYDGIQAFVLRSDPREHSRLRIVGEQFTRGLLSLAEIETLLSLDRVDVLQLLQSHGYQRPLAQLELSPQERADRLAAMRRDRLARAGNFEFTHEDVARDVIASERLEGVDARRWIPIR